MKISTAIEVLQSFQKTFGDIPIRVVFRELEDQYYLPELSVANLSSKLKKGFKNTVLIRVSN